MPDHLQDNEALTAHVARCMARDDQLEISLRAAHDRARVAESQSLDLTKQCEQAAATLGRLIDSNTELMNKINAQSHTLAGRFEEAEVPAPDGCGCWAIGRHQLYACTPKGAWPNPIAPAPALLYACGGSNAMWQQ